jgi:hypothetical protein
MSIKQNNGGGKRAALIAQRKRGEAEQLADTH